MRTSSQLNKTGACQKNARSSISGVSRESMLAGAQKNVLMRLLKGEPISDISGEIDSILAEKHFLWENLEQRLENEEMFEKRIKKFVAFNGGDPKIFPENMDTVVDYFGEQVKAEPDYFVELDNDAVAVCKITTSAYISDTEDANRQEMYALGLCGEKLFPGKKIYVDRMHLRPKTESPDTYREENGRYFDAYNGYSQAERCVTSIRFNNDVKEQYKTQYEDSKNSTCSPEECARCSQKNVCNFEQAPIFVPVEATVRPITDIRLSYEQRRATEFESGCARCNAGPGGGKTLVTAVRIATLLSKGYEPEDFCLLTYTNAGAQEMTARVMSYAASNGVPLDPERFCSGTINGFCQKIIEDHYQELGYTAPPRPIPEEKRKRVLNDLIDKYPKVSDWKYGQRTDSAFVNGRYSKNALVMIGNCFATIKREQLTVDTCVEHPQFSLYSSKDIATIFAMYNEFCSMLKEQNLLEFDDQLIEVNQLYDMNSSLFEEMGFKHILVDEFQDTDLPQIKLLQKMIDTTCFKSFMAVGDDSQSIFGFRHTSPEFMINFGNYFGRFEDFSLVENHRSTKAIVDFANSVNAKAQVKVDKDLIPTKEEGAQPTIQGYYSKKQEYEAIAADIARRWELGERDIAVLMSERNELHEMASALTKYGIPSVLMCRIPYLENSRVAALQTFYDSFMGNGNQGFIDYQNVLLNGALQGATAEQFDNTAATMEASLVNAPRGLETFLEFAEALDENQEDPCYQDFLEKVKFCRSSDELDEFWQEFRVYGASSEYKREGRYEGICLNTIHSAKGLEWDTTYLSLSKLDNTRLHNRASLSEKDETIRKFFVGATRARENLIMTGQYVLKMDQHGAVFNDFVKMAYDLLGKPYGYNYAEYRECRLREQADAVERAQTVTTGSRYGNGSNNGYGNRRQRDPEIAEAVARYNSRNGTNANRQNGYIPQINMVPHSAGYEERQE